MSPLVYEYFQLTLLQLALGSSNLVFTKVLSAILYRFCDSIWPHTLISDPWIIKTLNQQRPVQTENCLQCQKYKERGAFSNPDCENEGSADQGGFIAKHNSHHVHSTLCLIHPPPSGGSRGGSMDGTPLLKGCFRIHLVRQHKPNYVHYGPH